MVDDINITVRYIDEMGTRHEATDEAELETEAQHKLDIKSKAKLRPRT